jgi:NTP pyrophosphatase (non-canonical NTP hydrolase)
MEVPLDPRLEGEEEGEMRKTAAVLQAVAIERIRQDTKWGEQNHSPFGWIAILTEEVGEAAKAALEGYASQYRDELIQVAAVAVAAVESLSRGNIEGDALTKIQNELKEARKTIEDLKENKNASSL